MSNCYYFYNLNFTETPASEGYACVALTKRLFLSRLMAENILLSSS